jgi:hypothetical protein
VQSVRHAEAGAENRHDDRASAGQEGRVHFGDRCHDTLGGQRQRPRQLVAHEQRDLPQQLAEQRGRRFLPAHQRQLVLNQRMGEHEEISEPLVPVHRAPAFSPLEGAGY